MNTKVTDAITQFMRISGVVLFWMSIIPIFKGGNINEICFTCAMVIVTTVIFVLIYIKATKGR